MRRSAFTWLVVAALFACWASLACADGSEARDTLLFKPEVPAAPKDGAFTFVVMADPQPRDTSNPAVTPEEFLQTIREVNARAPAFSVICGDLIMGYTQDVALVEKMWDAFLDAVGKLDQPAFCVVGNHDVWSEASEAYFIERFGDVRWYSWDYGPAHFIVLDSEVVGQVDRIEGEQLEWLKRDLEASGDKRFKFVFMHKPRQYFGRPWRDEIHPLLTKHGVTAVFAGHWHSHRKEPALDGITYYVLSAAGGIGDGEEITGSFRSFVEVSVAGDEVRFALNRAGEMLPDDYVTADQVETVHALRRGAALKRVELPAVSPTAGMNGAGRVEIANTTPYKLEYTVALVVADGGRAEPVGEPSGTLPPDGSLAHEFRLECPSPGETRPFADPVVQVDYTVAFKHMTGRFSSRSPIPPTFTMPAELPEESAVDRAVKLDGAGAAVRIPFDEALNVRGPFTIEAWFNCESFSYVGGAMSRDEGGGYGLLLSQEESLYMTREGKPQIRFVIHDAGTGRSVQTHADGELLPLGRWTHIACTYDGETMAIWLDGKQVAEAAAPRTILPNKHPMYLGADLGWTGDPWAFMKGQIDEFRFSTVCRYTKPFTPAERYTPDKDTLVLYHLDRVHVNAVFDYSGNGHHGRLLGGAVLVEQSVRN